jgi:hypothetical protein
MTLDRIDLRKVSDQDAFTHEASRKLLESVHDQSLCDSQALIAGRKDVNAKTTSVPISIDGNLCRKFQDVSEKADPKKPDLLKLNFVTDPAYLAYKTLTGYRRFEIPSIDQVNAFQDRAWSLDRDAYSYLQDHDLEAAILSKQSIEDGSAMSTRAKNLLQRMQEDPTFQPVLAETNKGLMAVKTEWEANRSRTQSIMQDLTGLPLDGELTVSITHPAIAQGRTYTDSGLILWSNQNDFPNYNTIYLWHETLHNVIAPRMVGEDSFDVAHAVIELLTDDELQTRLNGGSYPPLIGHEDLKKGEEYLMPSWRDYLSCPGKKDIMKYLDEAAKVIESTPSAG